MDNTNPRPRGSLLVSLLMSIALLALFFMPWLRVSCDPRAVTDIAELPGMQDVPAELTGRTILASASGWDLARGKLTPDDRFKGKAPAVQENQEGPPAKPWAYGGLVLPGLLAGLALLCISGRLTSAGAGKCMLALGIGGVVLMFVAASVDYIDEAMDQATDEMVAQGAPVGQAAFRRDMAATAEQAKKLIQTKTTPYLWASLGLYVLIAGCGLVTMGDTEYVRPARSVAWRHDREATGGDLAAGRPSPNRDRRAPGRPLDFGPPLTPTEAPAPVAGDDVDGQT